MTPCRRAPKNALRNLHQDQGYKGCFLSRSCTTGAHNESRKTFTARCALTPTLAHPPFTVLSVVKAAFERFRGRPLALDAMYLAC